MTLGLIAGNGKFPFLVLEGLDARARPWLSPRFAKRPILKLNAWLIS